MSCYGANELGIQIMEAHNFDPVRNGGQTHCCLQDLMVADMYECIKYEHGLSKPEFVLMSMICARNNSCVPHGKVCLTYYKLVYPIIVCFNAMVRVMQWVSIFYWTRAYIFQIH